jgi:hypothetical protein
MKHSLDTRRNFGLVNPVCSRWIEQWQSHDSREPAPHGALLGRRFTTPAEIYRALIEGDGICA